MAPAPLSSLVVGLQGIFGILNGAANLLSSSAAEKNLEVLNLTSLPALHSIALGSIAIGYDLTYSLGPEESRLC
jgi:hypothetical protein